MRVPSESGVYSDLVLDLVKLVAGLLEQVDHTFLALFTFSSLHLDLILELALDVCQCTKHLLFLALADMLLLG